MYGPADVDDPPRSGADLNGVGLVPPEQERGALVAGRIVQDRDVMPSGAKRDHDVTAPGRRDGLLLAPPDPLSSPEVVGGRLQADGADAVAREGATPVGVVREPATARGVAPGGLAVDLGDPRGVGALISAEMG